MNVSSCLRFLSIFLHPASHKHCSFTETFFLTSLLCITSLFLIICLLIFQFSLLCWPWSFHPFLLPRLKHFTSRLSPRLGQLPPFNTTLISSFTLLHLFLPHSVSFCTVDSSAFSVRSIPSLSVLLPPLRLILNPVKAASAPLRFPSRLHHVHQGNETLETKIKCIRTAVGSLLRGQGVFLDAMSYFLTLPALLHPVFLCFSPFSVFLLGFFLSQTDTVTVLTVRGVCSD